ncbi:MAG: phosphoenolpyruvate carboxykinase (ATP) [Myxococcota bacterium]
MDTLHPYSVEYLTNPDQETLRSLTKAHTPSVFQSACGNLNKVGRNKARMVKYTYIIDDAANKSRYSHQLIDPAKAAGLIARQRAYIEEKGTLIEICGFLGLGKRAVGVQWLYTLEGANIAGMQSILSFPPEDVLAEGEGFKPTFRVVYTPDLKLDDMDGGQAILVDLSTYTTYIIGPDYFGESKKAALRMLNEYAFGQGGLVLHAGAKSVQIDGVRSTMTIMGLSGTGKTTTTFSKQGQVTQPIQDDMVAIWPGGELSITENGCFAKTFGLTEETEPVIYRGTLSADAWVENSYLNADGTYDFFKAELNPEEVARVRDVLIATGAPAVNVDRYITGSVSIAEVSDENGVLKDGWEFVKWTGNGRSIIPMSSIEDAADLHSIPAVHTMGILNRDEGADAATPGIVRFTSPAQAAGFFMLGETTKTSAAGKEVGKTRSPFTQPFFPLQFGLQAQRFSDLAATMPHVDMWMMNTGYVGGSARTVKQDVGFKVKIRHSSAMLEAMLKGEIVWKQDPDFGYEVVDVDDPGNAALIAKVPVSILSPARYYAESGRKAEYRQWVTNMKSERRAFLEKFAVDDAIISATCG